MLPGRKYTPEDFVAIAWRHKWLIIAFTVLATSAAVAISRRIPNIYRSETLILVIPQRVSESVVRSTVTVRIEDRLRSLRQEILSRSRLEQIIRDFSLYPKELETDPVEVVVAQMRERVNVDPIRDDAFRVTFDAESPRTAMIVTDRLAAMFIEENLRDREVQADGTNQFLESQLDGARKRLVEHEQKLEAYRKRYAGELPTQLQSNLQIIQGTQNQILTLSESISRDRDRRLVLEQSVTEAADDASATGAGSLTEEEKLIEQLDHARTELRDLQLRLRPEHPDVIAKRRVIAGLETKVGEIGSASAPRASDAPVAGVDITRRARTRRSQGEIEKLDQQIAVKEAEIQRLRQLVSEYGRRVEAVPGHESELVGLMRDYDTLQKIYADLLGKKENSQISVNLERQQVGEQFRVLDPARLPEEPFSPDRQRMALGGAAIGLLLAFGLIGFLEYRDVSLRTEDEIVRTLVLPVIAAIPVMTAVADLRRRKRNHLALAAAAAVAIVSAVSAVLWHLGR